MGGGGSAKIVCTFLGTKGPLEYHLFSLKSPTILLKQGTRKVVSVKCTKHYQSAPHDMKICMIMQSFAFVPFLFMEGHLSLVCLFTSRCCPKAFAHPHACASLMSRYTPSSNTSSITFLPAACGMD